MGLNRWLNLWLQNVQQEVVRGQQAPLTPERVLEDITVPLMLIGLPCMPALCSGRVGDLTFSEPLGWCMLVITWTAVAVRTVLIRCIGHVARAPLCVVNRSRFSLVRHVGAALFVILVGTTCASSYGELFWLLGILVFVSLRSAHDIEVLVSTLAFSGDPSAASPTDASILATIRKMSKGRQTSPE